MNQSNDALNYERQDLNDDFSNYNETFQQTPTTSHGHVNQSRSGFVRSTLITSPPERTTFLFNRNIQVTSSSDTSTSSHVYF